MADKLKAELGEIQETLLIPLYARAVETRKPAGMLHDPRAVEMVEAIDYDFHRFDTMNSLTGTTLRTLVFDEWVKAFLERSPDGTVVEIGTGLNTRFERVDNGRGQWFDLDLPDVVALRRAFFPDGERRRTVAASIAEAAWTERVHTAPAPYLFVAEAVLAFLDEARVRQVFSLLAERFPGSALALDTVGGAMMAAQDSTDILGNLAARMRWSCDDPYTPTKWRADVELAESITFSALPQAVWARLSTGYRQALRAGIEANRDRSESYRINLYSLG